MNTRATVLHIQKVNGVAGSENHLLTLLPELARVGYHPTMLVLADRDDQPEMFVQRMRASGVTTHIAPMTYDIDPFLIARLRSWFAERRWDIVHTHLFHAGVHGRLAAKATGAKIVSSYHNSNPFFTKVGIRQIEQLTARASDQTICISNAVRTFVQRYLNIPSHQLHVIHYGIQDQEWATSNTLRALFGIAETDIVLGVVARLVEQKGHVYLLEAMRALRDAGAPVHLMVVGDGNLRPSLEQMTRDLNLQSYVHFLGYRTDAAALMRDFDIFVLPTLFEGFGLVLLEAMAASLPVVATNTGPIPEIVRDGETGYLVPVRDPHALAAAIETLVANPQVARAFGQHGYAVLKDTFSVDAMVRQTADVYAMLA